MEEIFFPRQYKKALLAKAKNSTIRIGKEIGKYKTGEIYLAKSYAGRIWNIKVRIMSVLPTTLGRLSSYGIPRRSIEATIKKERVSLDEKVELIKFEVL